MTVVRVQALGGRPSVARPVPGGGAGPGSATMGWGPVAGARTGRRREDWVGEQQRLRSHPKQSHTAVACVGGGTLGRGGDGESRAACTAKVLWDSVLTDRSREAAGGDRGRDRPFSRAAVSPSSLSPRRSRVRPLRATQGLRAAQRGDGRRADWDSCGGPEQVTRPPVPASCLRNGHGGRPRRTRPCAQPAAPSQWAAAERVSGGPRPRSEPDLTSDGRTFPGTLRACVCVRVCMCVHMCVHMCACCIAHVCKHIHVCMHAICVCTCVARVYSSCVHECVHMYACVCM